MVLTNELRQKIYDLYVRDIIVDFSDFRMHTYWDQQLVYDIHDDGTTTMAIAVIHIFKVLDFNRYDIYIIADDKLIELQKVAGSDNPKRLLNYLKYNKWVNGPKKVPDQWMPEMSGQVKAY